METGMSKTRKPDLLLKNLMEFQRERANLDVLLKCIDDVHPSHVSIRNIEQGITKFAKRRNAVHEIPDGEDGTPRYFNIYLEQKSQLKAQNKELFDPFARRERVRFEYDTSTGEKKFLLTTIGQLNFFRWFIANKLERFIDENLVDIEWENNQEARAKRRDKNMRRETGASTSSTESGSSADDAEIARRRTRRKGDGKSGGCRLVMRPTVVSF